MHCIDRMCVLSLHAYTESSHYGTLAQLNVANSRSLRTKFRRMDALQRRSEILQEIIDKQARDLAKIYDHLMEVAQSGGETEAVVSELRRRVDAAAEGIASAMDAKAETDSVQRTLMDRQKRHHTLVKRTDARLSHIMGSFITKIESEIDSHKRSTGEAAAALRQRFTSQLRGSIRRVAEEMRQIKEDVTGLRPLTVRDTTNLGSMTITRCMTCSRPVVSTNPTVVPGSSCLSILNKAQSGGLQGSLLVSPTRPTTRMGESRGGGFRVNGPMAANAVGAARLWVGGDDSPTGSGQSRSMQPRRPASSLGFREIRR